MTLDYLRSRFVYRHNAGAYRLRDMWTWTNKFFHNVALIIWGELSCPYIGDHLWNNLPFKQENLINWVQE